jgi:uncharacterized membrane protein YtjA (UPF0391 family)
MENAVQILPSNCRGSPCEPPRPVPVPRLRVNVGRTAVQQKRSWNFSLAPHFSSRRQLENGRNERRPRRRKVMLNLVVTLLIIALIAAVLGFGGIAGAAVGIAKVVFLVALVLFVVAAIAGTIRTV